MFLVRNIMIFGIRSGGHLFLLPGRRRMLKQPRSEAQYLRTFSFPEHSFLRWFPLVPPFLRNANSASGRNRVRQKQLTN